MEILGQFARLPTGTVGDGGQRVDARVLLIIGQCPFPMLRANEEGLGHLEHDLGDLGLVLTVSLPRGGRIPVDELGPVTRKDRTDAPRTLRPPRSERSVPVPGYRMMMETRSHQAGGSTETGA
jgi:hypothetical protein